MPYIPVSQYATASAYDLLQAAADGFIGFDQRLIHALVDDPKRTLPDLVRFAGSVTDDSDFDLDLELIHIFHQLNVADAVPFYGSLIRACVYEIPDELTEAVIALGAPMLEPLLALYAEIGEEEGGEIAFILAGLGVRDQRVLDLLLERLEYDAADGAISLSLYADPTAIPHIQRILDEVPKEDKDLRHALRSAIEQIDALAKEPEIAAPAFDIFELYEEEEDPEFRALSEDQRVALLEPESLEVMPPRIRALAAASFENDELAPPARARLLEIAKSDPDPNVRGRAWESLAYEAGEPDVMPFMLEAARKAPVEERTGAVVALSSGPEPSDEIANVIEALYSEPDARAKTLEAMWKSLDRRFQKYMVKHLEDSDVVVRHQAITGVGYLGIGSEAPRLVGLFKDDEFRENALLAYALAVPTEVSRARMKPLLRRISDLAGELSFDEEEMLHEVLDQRLVLHGHKPVFHPEGDHAEPEEPVAVAASSSKAGRNDPCPCGSGKKYKKCHGA